MATERSLAKDFHDLMKNIKSFSDGQATVSKWDDENLGNIEVTISPNDGMYKEGEFVFEIVMESYDDVPRVYCKTAIYHPNIDTIQDPDGELCLNLFDVDVWTSDCGMQDIVQGLLFLMYNPNLDDPLCSAITSSTMEEFAMDVEKSIAGERVGDYQFPVNARYARLHPSVKEGENSAGEEKEEEKEDEKGSEKVGKDGHKDELIEDVKDGDDEERTGPTGADGCKEDLEQKTEGEEQLVPRYFGIKEIVSERPFSEEEDNDEDDDDEENFIDEEEDEENHDLNTDELDIDDGDIVKDEDLFDLIDDQDAIVDEENRKNLDGFDSVVSWSKMVYGAENKAYMDKLQVLIEDLSTNSTGLTNSTSLQGACKDSGNVAGPTSDRILQNLQQPTVESRFYHALRTRAFRRWLV